MARILLVLTLGLGAAAQAPLATLTGLAVLPADTFADGAPSGAWLRAEAREAQFPSQPVQGISALWPAAEGEWWALSDNGYGTKINSPDFLLRIYRLAVHWGDSPAAGAVDVREYVQLSDPARKLPFHITHERSAARPLSGADLDPESMVRMADGTFWIGDEFGPFLVHLSPDGRVLEAPYEIPGMRSPDHPHLLPADAGQTSAATVRRSRGFEGLALFGDHLYALIEAGTGADGDAALIHEFDVHQRRFTGQSWRLPLTSAEHAVTEFVSLAPLAPECAARFLAIERDNGHGRAAALKRVRQVHLAGGALVSHVVADLLNIADPRTLAGSTIFTFPFITTEAVWPTSRSSLVLANDNNYPAGGGRPDYTRDPTEFIRLELGTPLCAE